MKTTEDIISKLRQPAIQDSFRAHGFSRVSLFGSYARGTSTPQSDLDLLVERSSRGFTFFDLFAFEQDLARRLGVPEVQITITPKHRQERFIQFRKYIQDDLISIVE